MLNTDARTDTAQLPPVCPSKPGAMQPRIVGIMEDGVEALECRKVIYQIWHCCNIRSKSDVWWARTV